VPEPFELPEEATRLAIGEVRYERSKRIAVGAVHRLFVRNGWKDWHTRRDTARYIARALFVATAWSGRKAIGMGTLYGDGLFTTSVETLLVDHEFQRRGIGTTLLKMLLEKVDELRPYSFSTDVHLRHTERLYARFGFERHQGSVFLDHAPTVRRFTALVRKRRASLKLRANR
jgi:GNAT superfamily N-acetyltransferase